MDVDFIVIDKWLYTFNYRFEDVFHIEKTMKKVKNNTVDKIVNLGAIDDEDTFRKYVNHIKHHVLLLQSVMNE